MREWDEIDKEIVREVIESPGRSIWEAIRPLLKQRSENTLRNRVRVLEVFGIVSVSRVIGARGALIYPTEGSRAVAFGPQEGEP